MFCAVVDDLLMIVVLSCTNVIGFAMAHFFHFFRLAVLWYCYVAHGKLVLISMEILQILFSKYRGNSLYTRQHLSPINQIDRAQ